MNDELIQDIVLQAINKYLGEYPTNKEAKRYAEMNYSSYKIACMAVEIALNNEI